MPQGNDPKDKRLIQELYDKLNWLTFEAEEGEFDPEQVNAILQLLDVLDPQKKGEIGVDKKGKVIDPELQSGEMSASVGQSDPLDADAAFLRFKKRYNITDAELAHMDHKNGEDIRISEHDLELSEELSFDSEDIRKRLEQFRSKEAAATASVSDADLSDSDIPKSESSDLKRGASANPNGMAAHPGTTDTDAFTSGTETSGGAVTATAALNRNLRGTRKFRAGMLGKIAAALVVVAAAFTALNVGTSTVSQKSFFEIVRDGVNGMKITITGNEVETVPEESWVSTEEVYEYYNSWDEMEEALGVDLVQPGYIPDDLELNVISSVEADNYIMCEAVYGFNKELIIKMNIYNGDYTDENVHNNEGWIKLESPNENLYNADFYVRDDMYRAFLHKENALYFLLYDNFDELIKIVNEMI